MNIELIYWAKLTKDQQLKLLKRNEGGNDTNLSNLVKEIINNVKNRGDEALFEYTEKFDKVKLTSLIVSEEEYAYAQQKLEEKYKQAIIKAIDNIQTFHSESAPKQFELTKDGINLGKIYRPIEKVGLYIPGGTAPLVSTLLMLAIPAKIAGCPTKVLVTPPQKDGLISSAILFASRCCGIETIYKVGGAQAIAALAFGTETIPKVYKVFGPGNQYVTEAKIQVSNSYDGAALDMPAGPSEVLIIADEKASPQFIASDLLAQAEHDKEAQVILVTPDAELAYKVIEQLKSQIKTLSRQEIINESLKKSRFIIAKSIDDCYEISNLYAPEHLIIHIERAKEHLNKVKNAGSVFIGPWSPESVGDYASGTNHVLPTYGYANMYSGLGVEAFMKAISFQNLSEYGLLNIGTVVEQLAELEGLDAHKNAVTLRLNSIRNK